MASVFLVSRDVKQIGITIFDGGITGRNRENLDNICKKFNRNTPEFVHLDYLEILLGDHIQADRGSIMQYARLFMGRLPYEKVLYLDCDVMLRMSVSNLWNIDLRGRTIAAMQDVFSRHYRQGMELNPGEPIYNDGVLLADLEKWRKNSIEEKALNYIHRHFGNPIKNDLGALNAVLSRDTLALPPSWNAVTAFYDFSYEDMRYYRKPPEYYPKNVVIKAASDPYAVHFTSSFLSNRPWEEGCRHPFAMEWMNVRKHTPWAEEPLEKPRKSVQTRILIRLPWWLTIRIAAFLQAFVRPQYYLLKERVKKIEDRIASRFCHHSSL